MEINNQESREGDDGDRNTIISEEGIELITNS